MRVLYVPLAVMRMGPEGRVLRSSAANRCTWVRDVHFDRPAAVLYGAHLSPFHPVADRLVRQLPAAGHVIRVEEPGRFTEAKPALLDHCSNFAAIRCTSSRKVVHRLSSSNDGIRVGALRLISIRVVIHRL